MNEQKLYNKSNAIDYEAVGFYDTIVCCVTDDIEFVTVRVEI